MEEQKLTESPKETETNGEDLERKHATETTTRLTFTGVRISTSSPLDLHRRCAETIERCSASLRERQRKMERLQLVLPLPKSAHRQEDRSRATPTRSTPPRPTKRNKLNYGSTFSGEKNSSSLRSPAWSFSSSMSGSSARLRFDEMTTSPLVNRNSNNHTKVRIPFRVTPSKEKKNENEKTATQESTPASCNEGTLDCSTDKSTDSSHKKVTVLSPTWAQRQQDFMAAIEAEADNDDATSS